MPFITPPSMDPDATFDSPPTVPPHPYPPIDRTAERRKGGPGGGRDAASAAAHFLGAGRPDSRIRGLPTTEGTRLGPAAKMPRSSSLLALLSLTMCLSRADVTHQWPCSIGASEGASAEMNCYQNGTIRSNMLWYRQSLAGGFELIGYVYVDVQYEQGFKSRFHMTKTMEKKKSTLKIETVKPEDEAVYLCAASEGTRRCRVALHRYKYLTHTCRHEKGRSAWRPDTGTLSCQSCTPTFH
ncbi:uncharacterized protein [Narcine bancroftii]|uniref:uncharacterized protein n=1 Tax=Narcine bancroftii TaxID=1343680 RepID=UPI003831B1E3